MSDAASPKPRRVSFEHGSLFATPGVLRTIPDADVAHGLTRHFRGDWGDLDEHDRQANEDALASGGRLFSTYHSTNNVKFWIITEADRSSTTVLLPSEY